ncbi:unnamed protein product, partial [Adineta ricciae]
MHSTNNNLTGTAKTLERAMKVNRLSEMLDCFKDMKLYASTIEKDLPDYLNTIYANKTSETNNIESQSDDFLQLAKQRLHNHPYILLNDLIETKRNFDEYQSSPQLTVTTHERSSLEEQIKYMKDVIAAQPSALEGIYLEALLNPDQWQSDLQFLQKFPAETLTPSERKRLDKILSR